MNKTEAIRLFLLAKTHSDLANLYTPNMEVQVNVAKENGEAVKGDYKGRQWAGYSDGITTWKSFRIPYKAKTDPQYTDGVMSFDLGRYAEGIGMTGWDWKEKVSRWVAYDFDSIVGHSDKHAKKLTDEELKTIIDSVNQIDWIEVRHSTGGKGLHIYVYLPCVPTENHTEHAALARSILGKLSAQTGFNFSSKVDICGGNMWVWHRKMSTTNRTGLSLIKKAKSVLNDYPTNWRDHLNVINSRAAKTRVKFIDDRNQNAFEQIANQVSKSVIDADHKKLMDWLEQNKCNWWWDSDRAMLITHTIHLAEAHKVLEFRGIFKTASKHSSEINCFCFPLKSGSWVVKRFSPGVAEDPCWTQDGQGWTSIYFNREPDLHTASVTYGGVETAKEGYYFQKSDSVNQVLNALGSFVTVPQDLLNRETWIKPHKDGSRIIIEIASSQRDVNLAGLENWYNTGKRWQQIIKVNTVGFTESEDCSFDHIIRHVITENDEDYGWFISSNNEWTREPFIHIKTALQSLEGMKTADVNQVMGTAIFHSWKLVKRPFQPEYPGNRIWNRNSCQFKFTPTQETENLNFEHWKLILNHVGEGLNLAIQEDAWCKIWGINTGADYLLCWIASMIQQPEEPLPYLFLFGPQKSGKSIFHESLSLLFTTGGSIRADMALMNPSTFNAELENSVLCYIEEVNLSKFKGSGARIKDWVTSPNLTVHRKGLTPYSIKNTTHWIQCANDMSFCPVEMGDTRITVIKVNELDPLNQIPKKQLMIQLEKEAPDFIAHLLAMELPQTNDRLNIPVIKTGDKFTAEIYSANIVDIFLSKYFYRPGHAIKFKTLWDKFQEDMEIEDRGIWTKSKFQHELVRDGRYVIGRSTFDNNALYIGNISSVEPPKEEIKPSCEVRSDGVMIRTDDLTWES